MKTFEQNLNTLLKYKQELLGMKNTYSTEINNYHNINILEQQSNQLKSAYEEIDHLKQEQYNNSGKYTELSKELKQYNEQLKKENLFLQQENNLLQNRLQNDKEQVEQHVDQLHQKLREKDQEVKRQIREIENIKLMHSQELYILKKNTKK